MRLQKVLVLSIVVLTAIGLVGCGKEVPPEQRLAGIRYNHEIFPVAAKTLYDGEGNPTLLVDLQVVNQGGVPLSMLTVLVRVLGPDGAVKNSERVTLDLEGVQPGIGARVSASLAGVELLDEDEVTVELESNLSPEEIRQLPEFAVMTAAN